jgi:hypothetical protein
VNREAVYCRSWNRVEGRVGIPMLESEASRRHLSGESFTVALVSDKPVEQPILINCVWENDYASTTFLDEIGRYSTRYIFKGNRKENLFLQRVLIWSYPNSSPNLEIPEANHYQDMVFRKDGTGKTTEVNKEEGFREITDYTDLPVEGNWEPFPSFGDWGSIARYER